MNLNQAICITPSDARWFQRLRKGLGDAPPAPLSALGNLDLLALPKTALFCSARCPGDALLRTHDQAAKWRDEGRCVISGFHSPVEKECLRILLRGDAPIILCPARGLPKRLPAQQAIAVAFGRLLILSCFNESECRVTTELAACRNEFVAALGDDLWFAHITPDGQMEQLARKVSN